MSKREKSKLMCAIPKHIKIDNSSLSYRLCSCCNEKIYTPSSGFCFCTKCKNDFCFMCMENGYCIDCYYKLGILPSKIDYENRVCSNCKEKCRIHDKKVYEMYDRLISGGITNTRQLVKKLKLKNNNEEIKLRKSRSDDKDLKQHKSKKRLSVQ